MNGSPNEPFIWLELNKSKLNSDEVPFVKTREDTKFENLPETKQSGKYLASVWMGKTLYATLELSKGGVGEECICMLSIKNHLRSIASWQTEPVSDRSRPGGRFQPWTMQFMVRHDHVTVEHTFLKTLGAAAAAEKGKPHVRISPSLPYARVQAVLRWF